MIHDIPPSQFVHFFYNCASYKCASLIKIPKNPQADIAYQDLVCTEEDKKNIIELIKTMADNNKISLLLNQNHLKNIGAQINHVHPLKFLSVALGTEELKFCLIQIFKDYFKKNGFMDGLGPSLTREAEKGKLDIYLPPFADEMKVPLETIRPFVDAKDWEGFVSFLMWTQ